MTFVISKLVIGKLVLFAVISLVMSMFILFPMNDRPTSRGQYIFWGIVEVLLFAVMFDLISFRFVA